MTLRKIAAVLAWISVCTGFFACNSKYEPQSITLASSAVVSSFNFSSDDSVLANLDSVFFSIDLVKGEIFNADSLPKGTDITKLVPIITTMETASILELKVTRANGTDTTYNYYNEVKDSIDFTNPVVIRVVSANGDNERNYRVTVNVHTMDADTLTWTNISTTGLPSELASVTAQRTVRMGDNFACLTTDGNEWCMAVNTVGLSGFNGASMPASAWSTTKVGFPFQPDITTLTASESALYILSTDKILWTSDDMGATWSSTGLKWNHIYLGYQAKAVGNYTAEDGSLRLQEYPSLATAAMPADMPVSATSVAVTYTFPMSQRPQSLIVGGRKADGDLSASTWGYDGESWLKVSKTNLPQGIAHATVAPYLSITVAPDWSVKEFPTMLVLGGMNAAGDVMSTVYMSDDYGYHWSEAPSYLQLPAEMAQIHSAQAYVMASIFKADITPAIVKPIESWECPYIYMFGGINGEGTLSPTIWRGVINRLTFKPIE